MPLIRVGIFFPLPKGIIRKHNFETYGSVLGQGMYTTHSHQKRKHLHVSNSPNLLEFLEAIGRNVETDFLVLLLFFFPPFSIERCC